MRRRVYVSLASAYEAAGLQSAREAVDLLVIPGDDAGQPAQGGDELDPAEPVSDDDA